MTTTFLHNNGVFLVIKKFEEDNNQLDFFRSNSETPFKTFHNISNDRRDNIEYEFLSNNYDNID